MIDGRRASIWTIWDPGGVAVYRIGIKTQVGFRFFCFPGKRTGVGKDRKRF